MDYLNDGKTKQQLSLDRLPVRPEQLVQLQLERLQMVLNRAARNVSYYHDLFQQSGFEPYQVQNLSDLDKLPLTERKTLLERQPYGLLAVPPHDVVRIQTALGPQGHPIVVASTANDIQIWTFLTARALSRMRIGRDDTIYISLDYNQSSSAFGMQYGAEALGATVIPKTTTVLKEQVAVMKNYRASVLACTPSYARSLLGFFRDRQIDPKEMFLRTVILLDEPWDDAVRRKIAQGLFVNVYGAWGLDELFSPGVASEEAGQEDGGFLVNTDHFLVEMVDPETGKKLEMGQVGELVVTTLTREALPLIRYRTGELGRLEEKSLEGGRKVLQLIPAGQRTDDLVQVGGAGFYPKQVEDVLGMALPESFRFGIVIDPGEDRDRVEVQLEVSPSVFEGEMLSLSLLKDRVESELFLKFGITMHLRWMEEGALEKASVLDDRRPGAV
jgi:phenylacetate-CoA ligase